MARVPCGDVHILPNLHAINYQLNVSNPHASNRTLAWKRLSEYLSRFGDSFHYFRLPKQGNRSWFIHCILENTCQFFHILKSMSFPYDCVTLYAWEQVCPYNIIISDCHPSNMSRWHRSWEWSIRTLWLQSDSSRSKQDNIGSPPAFCVFMCLGECEDDTHNSIISVQGSVIVQFTSDMLCSAKWSASCGCDA